MRRFLGAIGSVVLLLALLIASPAQAVTPRPPEAKLFATAPEDCLFYLHNFGFTKVDSDSKNKTEQLVAEASVQKFVAEVKSLIDQGMEKTLENAGEEEAEVMTEVFAIAKMVIDRPFTLYIGDVSMGRFGPQDMDLGFVLDAGDKVGEVEKRMIKIQSTSPEGFVTEVTVAGVKCHCLKDPNANGPGAPPPIHWGKVGEYIVVAMGTDAMESLMANVKAPAPKWLGPALKRINVPRRWAFSYANIEKLNTLIADAGAPPEFTDVLKAFGVSDVSTISGAIGLDDEGMVSRVLIEASTDRGLLGLFDKNGLTAKDLEEIPKDVVNCFGMRMSPEKIVELFLDLAVQISPDEGAEVQVQLDGLSEAIGVDIRKDILAGLGDRWLVYTLPGNAGPMVPNMVMSVDVRDATGVQKGLTLLKQTMDNQGGSISIAETEVGDHAAYYLKGAPVAPAWCLTKDRLVIALQKSSIGKLLDSPPAAADSLASHPRVTSMLSKYEKPLMISYNDAEASVSTMYQALPMLLNMAAGALEEQGIEFDATNLPPLEDLVKHLDPAVSVIHRAKDGIEFASRKTIPSVGGAMMPLLVGMGLPAVQQARGAARRVESMNNLRQLGLACLNFESATQRFPAKKIGKDGKFGLSWRVAILPFIEEQDLYDQFHLDEPWDSEHNKKLISKMPAVFRSPKSKADEGKTNYLAVGGEDSAITGEGEGIGFRDMTDGTSNTILAVEVDDAKAVIWTKPDDFEWDEDDPMDGLGGIQAGKFVALFCDCSVQMIADDVDEDVVKALYTKSGGEVVNREDYSK